MKIRVDHSMIPRTGETVSGDAGYARSEGGRTLFGIIDALGHGPKAAEAKEMAVAYLDGASLDASVGALMEGVHKALRGSRGAAATLCLFEGGQMQGCGVGNVELVSVRAKFPFGLTPGILGSRMRPLRVFEGTMPPGGRIILHSDGISTSILEGDARNLPFAELCKQVMQRYRKAHDDATVLVADVAEGT